MSKEGRLARGKVYAEKGIENSEAAEYLESLPKEETPKKTKKNSKEA